MIEILQTIWNSLTTENEVLTKIIGIPFVAIEAYVSLLLFSTILKIPLTYKKKLFYVTTVSIFGILFRYFIPTPYSTYLNIIMMTLSIMFIFKLSFIKSIFALLFPFVITAFLESILTKLYHFFFNMDFIVGSNIPLHRLVITSIVYFIMFLIYLILKHFNVNLGLLEILDKKKKVLLLLNTLFGLILIGLQIYMITFYMSYLPSFIVILNMIALISYFSISIFTVFTVSKLEATSTNLEEAQLYNKTLEILQDNTRAFRHDFANILQGMVGFMDNNDMEGLKKYYSQLVEDIQYSNNLTTLSPKVVNNPAIYNVLASKYHKADSLGIKIHLEAFLDMNELHMKIYEFTRVLGILMDNAIEAAKECENKIINVTFRKDNKRHMQLLIIENTYNDKDVDTDKIFEKGYSTKEGNTGLGLWEIRQILKKNNNLNLYTTKNDTYFSQQFEIFY